MSYKNYTLMDAQSAVHDDWQNEYEDDSGYYNKDGNIDHRVLTAVISTIHNLIDLSITESVDLSADELIDLVEPFLYSSGYNSTDHNGKVYPYKKANYNMTCLDIVNVFFSSQFMKELSIAYPDCYISAPTIDCHILSISWDNDYRYTCECIE